MCMNLTASRSRNVAHCKKANEFCSQTLQLNEYETEPYFLQIFQSNTTVCLIIHVLCKSCGPEIALNSNQNRSAQY